MATSHVSSTLSQQPKAGGTRAALLTAASIEYVHVGFAVWAAPSPGLGLSDPPSWSRLRGSSSAVDSTWSFVCRAFNYYLLNESSKNFVLFFSGQYVWKYFESSIFILKYKVPLREVARGVKKLESRVSL